MIGQDGLAGIHARLAAVRLAKAADPGSSVGWRHERDGPGGHGRSRSGAPVSGRWSVLKGEASVASAPSRMTRGRDCPVPGPVRLAAGAVGAVPARSIRGPGARSALGAWRAAVPSQRIYLTGTGSP